MHLFPQLTPHQIILCWLCLLIKDLLLKVALSTQPSLSGFYNAPSSGPSDLEVVKAITNLLGITHNLMVSLCPAQTLQIVPLLNSPLIIF